MVPIQRRLEKGFSSALITTKSFCLVINRMVKSLVSAWVFHQRNFRSQILYVIGNTNTILSLMTNNGSATYSPYRRGVPFTSTSSLPNTTPSSSKCWNVLVCEKFLVEFHFELFQPTPLFFGRFHYWGDHGYKDLRLQFCRCLAKRGVRPFRDLLRGGTMCMSFADKAGSCTMYFLHGSRWCPLACSLSIDVYCSFRDYSIRIA